MEKPASKKFFYREKYGKTFMRYYTFDKEDYWIPIYMEERFTSLRKKIQQLDQDGYTEAKVGYSIVFKDEFRKYKITFKKRSTWNDYAKIVYIKGSFIFYKKVFKKFGFYFSTGPIYTLNKWSFLRLFGVKYE